MYDKAIENRNKLEVTRIFQSDLGLDDEINGTNLSVPVWEVEECLESEDYFIEAYNGYLNEGKGDLAALLEVAVEGRTNSEEEKC